MVKDIANKQAQPSMPTRPASIAPPASSAVATSPASPTTTPASSSPPTSTPPPSAQVAAQVQLARLGGDATRRRHDHARLPQRPRPRSTKPSANSTTRPSAPPWTASSPASPTPSPASTSRASNAAFGLVSTDHVWVEANPKETELTYVKPGDPVSVTIDTYPGRTWQGTVDSIAPASGSEFSILPAQNSSGNWVKVVQRITVRIRLDRKPQDPPLRAGMSVEADIDTGHTRSLSDLF